MLLARLLPRFALVLLALSLLAQPALAQWKWRDKNGRVTVSDIPPPRDIPDKDVLSRPEPMVTRVQAPQAASAASAVPVKAPVDPELQARKKAGDQEAAAKASAEAAKVTARRQENCRNARSHLTAMESGQRMARMNEKGEREILDDAQRAEEARRAREVISSDCGD